MKKLMLFLFMGILLIFLLCCPIQAVAAAKNGLVLCAETIVPSLFPFFMLSSFFINTGYSSLISRPLQPIFSRLFGISSAGTGAFFLGSFAGYPVGAKSVAELRETKQISAEEANRLLRFCNNAGPLFLIGTVGAGMFGNVQYGYLLLFSHLISSAVVGVLFRRNVSSDRHAHPTNIRFSWDFFSESLSSSVTSILSVCGSVILFQVFIAALHHFGILTFFAELLTAGKAIGVGKSILSGIIEMTSGIRIISQLHGYSDRILLSAVSLLIGFGGLCVHIQTFTFIKKLSKKTYLTGKLLQGMFSAIFTYCLYPKFFSSASVFYAHTPTSQEIRGELILTLFLLAITLLLYLGFFAVSFFRSQK